MMVTGHSVAVKTLLSRRRKQPLHFATRPSEGLGAVEKKLYVKSSPETKKCRKMKIMLFSGYSRC